LRGGGIDCLLNGGGIPAGAIAFGAEIEDIEYAGIVGLQQGGGEEKAEREGTGSAQAVKVSHCGGHIDVSIVCESGAQAKKSFGVADDRVRYKG
jgi:hypothetical protein